MVRSPTRANPILLFHVSKDISKRKLIDVGGRNFFYTHPIPPRYSREVEPKISRGITLVSKHCTNHVDVGGGIIGAIFIPILISYSYDE